MSGNMWDKPWEPPPSENDKIDKAMEDYRKGGEIQKEVAQLQLEATKLKVFGRTARKSGMPLIGDGVRLLTDFELPAVESQRWLLKHVIPDTGFGVVYGDSGTFKSFVVLDMMAAIATGQEHWFGYRVRCAPCIYVPFEGRGGIPKRVEAWRLARLLQRIPTDPAAPVFPINFEVTTGIIFITDPLNLRNEADRDKLVQSLTSNELAGGVLCIDTLAQAGGGIDENSSEDMGLMIHAFQDLQARLGGVTLATHHTGKDASRGMRGHSSLRGAVDFAIECSRVDGPSKYDAQMRLDKVKDDEAGTLIPFTMQRVTLGVDEDGDHITSLFVVQPQLNPNMRDAVPHFSKDVQNDEDDEAFIWEWVEREGRLGNYPSVSSLCGQLAEMKEQRPITQKRVRDAVHRLKARSTIVTAPDKSPSNNAWLRAVTVPGSDG